jgi:hypothetical protein
VKRAEALAKRVLLIVAALLCALYIGDYVLLRHQMSVDSNAALGTIQVRRYWEIPNKSGKLEFSFDPPAMQTCVHSLFPHLGYSPCWYVSREKLQRVAQFDTP